ncbi:MAG: hypothetical protein WA081_08180 [Desulfosalsimonadaceae bacterium]
MSRWHPCKRREFINRIRKLDFYGPYSGTRHQFMVYKEFRLAIPSNAEYPIAQIRMMINEIESILGRVITVDEWNTLA